MILLPYLLARRRQPVIPKKRGLTEDPVLFLERHSDILECLRAGRSLRQTQANTGKARNTVLKVKRMIRP